jgi:acyl carrier protein
MTGGSLLSLVSDVLRVPVEHITEATSAATVGEWTSLAHLQLIKAVEDAYQVSLTPREIRGIRSVADLRTSLRQRGIAP